MKMCQKLSAVRRGVWRALNAVKLSTTAGLPTNLRAA